MVIFHSYVNLPEGICTRLPFSNLRTSPPRTSQGMSTLQTLGKLVTGTAFWEGQSQGTIIGINLILPSNIRTYKKCNP